MEIESFAFEPEPIERFVELPFEIYSGDERWIPPLRWEVRRLLSPENPFFRYGEMRSFLVSEGGRALGRCSAIVNRELRHQGEPVGLVGFFECRDDPDAAARVVGAAVEWLRERGLRHLVGPMSFGIWHSSYRLMTRGFDRTPFLGEPYNPTYYPELFARLGWTPLARWYSWDLDEFHLQAMLAGAEAMKSQAVLDEGYRMEPLRLDRFGEDLRRLHRLMIDAFRENLCFTPIPEDEFEALFGGMKLVVIPSLVPFVLSPKGETIAAAYLYPDHGNVFRAMKGDASLMPRLPDFVKKEPPDRLVFHTVAVLKEHRKKGLIETFFGPLLRNALETGFRRGVGALAKEGPTVYAKTGPATREYTLYELRV